MPEMDDRIVIVTGVNSGLSYEATRAFARNGAHIVMACRSEECGEIHFEDLQQRRPTNRTYMSRASWRTTWGKNTVVERPDI